MPSILNASVNWVCPSKVLATSAFTNRFPVLADSVFDTSARFRDARPRPVAALANHRLGHAGRTAPLLFSGGPKPSPRPG